MHYAAKFLFLLGALMLGSCGVQKATIPSKTTNDFSVSLRELDLPCFSNDGSFSTGELVYLGKENGIALASCHNVAGNDKVVSYAVAFDLQGKLRWKTEFLNYVGGYSLGNIVLQPERDTAWFRCWVVEPGYVSRICRVSDATSGSNYMFEFNNNMSDRDYEGRGDVKFVVLDNAGLPLAIVQEGVKHGFHSVHSPSLVSPEATVPKLDARLGQDILLNCSSEFCYALDVNPFGRSQENIMTLYAHSLKDPESNTSIDIPRIPHESALKHTLIGYNIALLAAADWVIMVELLDTGQLKFTEYSPTLVPRRKWVYTGPLAELKGHRYRRVAESTIATDDYGNRLVHLATLSRAIFVLPLESESVNLITLPDDAEHGGIFETNLGLKFSYVREDHIVVEDIR